LPYRRPPPRKQYQQGTRKAPVQRGFQHGAGGHPVLEAKMYSQKWSVPSSSDPNKTYTVSLTADGEWECSCPQWIYRRQECKHIQRVKNSPIGAIATSAKSAKKTGQLTFGEIVEGL